MLKFGDLRVGATSGCITISESISYATESDTISTMFNVLFIP